METLEFRGACFTVWDVGGQDRIRALWKHYYSNTHGVIFVLDSADTDRIDMAKRELRMMLQEPELQNANILVYANKQDLPGAMKASEAAERLELTREKRRRWHVQSACATNGDGLVEGLSWLWDAIHKTM